MTVGHLVFKLLLRHARLYDGTTAWNQGATLVAVPSALTEPATELAFADASSRRAKRQKDCAGRAGSPG